MSWVHRTLIVPAANALVARRLCDGLAPVGSGSNMFISELSATGSLPVTHYISSGLIQDNFAALLDAGAAVIYSQAQLVPAIADITLLQVQALMTAATITGNDPYTTLSSLGLKKITGSI